MNRRSKRQKEDKLDEIKHIGILTCKYGVHCGRLHFRSYVSPKAHHLGRGHFHRSTTQKITVFSNYKKQHEPRDPRIQENKRHSTNHQNVSARLPQKRTLTQTSVVPQVKESSYFQKKARVYQRC